MEELREVTGYSKYRISKDGRVFSLVRKRFLTPRPNSMGYPRIILQTDDRGQKQILIHRLVALAWVPNPDGKPCINHMNGNKQDARAENLEWVTLSENNFHAHRCLPRKSLGKPVVAVNLITFETTEYESIAEAVKAGFDRTGIWRCATGQIKEHRGFLWSYCYF